MRTRVKICCIADREEARWAVAAGADALGLVSTMPSGPGVIAEETIADIASQVPPGVTSILLTSRQDADGIVAQHRRCRTHAIQLTDRLTADQYALLRDSLPGLGLIQVVHVGGEDAIMEAVEASRWVNAILLDSGRPHESVKILGGTGEVHDWTISRRIRDAIGIPLFLAGGLNPENAAQAIAQVAPFGLDICSGVRTDGRLDAAKLARFFAQVR